MSKYKCDSCGKIFDVDHSIWVDDEDGEETYPLCPYCYSSDVVDYIGPSKRSKNRKSISITEEGWKSIGRVIPAFVIAITATVYYGYGFKQFLGAFLIFYILILWTTR